MITLIPHTMYLSLWCTKRVAFHNKFPRFLSFGFFRKIAWTKTQQGTDKASEHNGHAVFLRDLILLMRALTGVVSNLYYRLSSIHYTSSPFLLTSFFVSASATNRVRHHRQIKPPTMTEYAIPLVWLGMQNNMTDSPPE